MQLNINYKPTEEPVTITIDDECNHAGADYEDIDFGYASYEHADWIDDWRTVLVCDKCDAWYNDHYESWEAN